MRDNNFLPLDRRQALWLLAVGAAGLVGRRAFAAVPVGKAVSIDGPVAIERDAASRDLLVDDVLMLDDNVTTRENGFAALLLADKTRINLGADSQLIIEQFIVDQGGEMSIGGAMLFDRPEDLPKLDMTIKTAFGQIGVRGTRFFAGPTRGKFSVFVDRGSVEVTGAGISRTLKAGEGVEFAAVGAPPGEVVTWGQGRIDEAFALVRVARKMPPSG